MSSRNTKKTTKFMIAAAMIMAAIGVFSWHINKSFACTNPSPLPSGYSNPCPVGSLDKTSINQGDSLTLTVTPTNSSNYIYTTVYLSNSGSWLPKTLTSSGPYSSYTNATSTLSLSSTDTTSLTAGTHYLALWDWAWDNTQACYVGPNSSTCNTGTWRVITVSVTASLPAGTFTVKQAGGGDYTTIQACANAITAGQTCLVYAGTYNERVAPAHSGSAGSRIIFKVNAGDTVNVDSFDLTNRTYVTIGGSASNEGFRICATYTANACVSLYVSNNDTIQNNTIGGTSVGGGGSTGCINNGFATSTYSSYLSILYNTIQWCGPMGSTDATKKAGNAPFYLRGDHWLVDGNTSEHNSEFSSNSAGSYNVIRNNTWQNVDCTTDFGANNPCHMDALEISCSASILPAAHILFEDNRMLNVQATGAADGRALHGILAHAGSCVGVGNIIYRFNYFYNADKGALVQGDNTTGVFDHLVEYNNTVNTISEAGHYDSTFSGATGGFGALNGRSKNSLFYNAMSTGAPLQGIYLDAYTAPTFQGDHDLFYVSGATFSTSTICNSNPTVCTNFVLNQNPLVNSDWTLQAGSPASGAGTGLTTVTSGCNSTALVVGEANYFQDGFGISGVGADWVRVGASSSAQISSVNYSTNTLNFSSPVSCTNGDPVYLYKNSSGTQVLTGSASNIGAY